MYANYTEELFLIYFGFFYSVLRLKMNMIYVKVLILRKTLKNYAKVKTKIPT